MNEKTLLFPKEFITNPLPYKAVEQEGPISYVSDNGFQRTVYQSGNGNLLGGLNGRLLLCALYTHMVKQKKTYIEFKSLKEIIESVGIYYNNKQLNKLKKMLLSIAGTHLSIIKNDWKSSRFEQKNIQLARGILCDASQQGYYVTEEGKGKKVGGRLRIELELDKGLMEDTKAIPIKEDELAALRAGKSPLLFDLFLYIALKKSKQQALFEDVVCVEWDWLYQQFHGNRFQRARDFKEKVRKALHKIAEIRGDIKVEVNDVNIFITYYELEDE